jgi:SAM-dependent methyltransferase
MMVSDWSTDFYKHGFEGYESASAFPTAQALEDYRAMLLGKTAHQVEFIARHVGRRPLRVMEIGSGNGRLLIGLAEKGLLEHGLGVEIAASRVEFARRWAADRGLSQVENVVGDALAFDDSAPGTFDLSVCLTGAFNYLEPIRETAAGEALVRMRAALKPGGSLLLEIHDMQDQRREALALEHDELRIWNELPPADRFRYYLVEYKFWPDRRMLRVRKVFIGRDGTIDAGREEVLRYYKVPELVALLERAGFERIRVFGDFADGPHQAGQSTVCVLLAQPAAGAALP